MKAFPERILMTADPVGGVWTYALELVRALADHEIEVHLATKGVPLDGTQRQETAELPNLHLEESTFRLEWMTDCWDDVRAAGEWLLDLESRCRPDIVHLNDFSHGSLPWHAPALVVGHSCVYSWFHAVRRREPDTSWEAYRRHVSLGLQGADLVTAPTASMLASLRRHYGSFRATTPIYNGRRSSGFRALPKSPVIAAVGRVWDEGKNVKVLDEVARYLEWPVHVIGETRHPLGGEVRFESVRSLGRLEPQALAEELGKAAILVHPALYEPFGLAPLEAALSGCALVLGDLRSLREVWGDAAAYVAPDDPPGIADVVRAISGNDRLRASFAQRARQRAIQLTAHRMAEGYLEAYGQLLTERRARHSPRTRISSLR